LRAVGQRLGCVLALGLAVVGVLALSGSARLSEVILAQTSMVGPLPCWNVWRQPLGLLVFVVAWLVQIDRPPFGLGAAGSAVAGGFLTHYGGARRLLFQWTEYVYLLAGSALVVTFYGGGWHLPYLATVGPGSLWQELLKVAVFGLKTACVGGRSVGAVDFTAAAQRTGGASEQENTVARSLVERAGHGLDYGFG
jgi:NADH-quinone oxidoreductase subunit H